MVHVLISLSLWVHKNPIFAICWSAKTLIIINDWAKIDMGLLPVPPLISHSHSVSLYSPFLPFSLLYTQWSPKLWKTVMNILYWLTVPDQIRIKCGRNTCNFAFAISDVTFLSFFSLSSSLCHLTSNTLIHAPSLILISCYLSQI